MKNTQVSMKIKQWVLVAILMTSGLGVLSSCHQIIEEHIQDVVCQWVSDYAEEGVDQETGLAYNRIVEVYEFSEKNAGYYECYLLNDDGQWQAVTSREFQDYFVDGTLLATRWKNEGEAELREWWEIASIADCQMEWTALRQNADGTTVQQTMTWKRIEL